MGSKKIKAIAVTRGSKKVEVKDKEKLAKIADEFYQIVKAFTGTVGGVYKVYKTGKGTLPIKNYMTNLWDIENEKFEGFSEAYVRKKFNPKPNPCWTCRLTHSTIMTIPEGPYQGMVVEEPEYEQLAAWGPVIDQRDIFSAAMLSSLIDRLGLLLGRLAGWMVDGMLRKGVLREGSA